MGKETAPRKTETISLVALTVLTLLTFLASLAFWSGTSPWFLYLESLALSSLALSLWLRKSMALTLALLGNLALYSLLLPVFALAPGSLSTKIFFTVLLVIIGSSLILSLKFKRDQFFSVYSIFKSNKFLFFSIGALISGFIIQCLLSPNFAFWAMNNDAVWNTVTTRFLIADGGLNGFVHPNASPLTAGLLALATSPGREVITQELLLSHDIGLQSQLWSAIVILTCLLAATVASLALQNAKSVIRWVGILGSIALPLTWFYSGFAVRFGFYNASIVTMVLLGVWIVWLNHESNIPVSILAFCLGSIVLLATWAPLVLVSGFFIAYLLMLHIKALLSGWKNLVTTLTAFLLLGGYTVFVTLRDLTREGGALAVDGGIFDFLPVQFGLVTVLAVIVSLLMAHFMKQSLWGNGVLVVVLAAIFGTGFLAFQRRNAESMWGYYPIKFGWLITTLLIVIIFVGLLYLISRMTISVFYETTFVIASGAVVVLLMALSGLVSPKNVLTPVGIVTDTSAELKNDYLQQLSRMAVVGEKNIAVGYSPTPQEDLAFNNWLLQINSQSSEDPIRWFSYYLDGTDINMVCHASQTWGEDVVIHTRSEAVVDSITQNCPTSARVLMHE